MFTTVRRRRELASRRVNNAFQVTRLPGSFTFLTAFHILNPCSLTVLPLESLTSLVSCFLSLRVIFLVGGGDGDLETGASVWLIESRCLFLGPSRMLPVSNPGCNRFLLDDAADDMVNPEMSSVAKCGEYSLAVRQNKRVCSELAGDEGRAIAVTDFLSGSGDKVIAQPTITATIVCVLAIRGATLLLPPPHAKNLTWLSTQHN